ncbi:hypothetical protein PFISCL1PPCAC_25869, partial [Pristionchus fissidentatus]
QMSSKKDNWTAASSACEKDASTLISIHNKQVNDYARRSAVSAGLIDGMHIGAHVSTSGATSWVDGTPMDYNNFEPGFPIAGLGECSSMDTNMVTGQ